MSTLNAMIPSQESLAGKEKENLKIIRKIWQQYGLDGNGQLDTSEAKHFVNQFMYDTQGDSYVPDHIFNSWFRMLDRDGDGRIDMIEMVHNIKHLQKDLQNCKGRPVRNRALENTIQAIKARATAVTVGDLMTGK